MSPLGSGALGSEPLGGGAAGTGATATGLTVRLAGEDVTTRLLWGSLSIEDDLNARNTARLTLRQAGTGLTPAAGQTVQILWNGVTRFEGTIEEPRLTFAGQAVETLWELDAVDYNQLADRFLVTREYTAQTVGAIARALVADYLAADGVTHDYVQEGPVVPVFRVQDQTVAETLSDLCRPLGWAWNIDYQRRLHVFPRESYFAPITLAGQFVVESLSVARSRSRYRNRQILAGGQATSTQTRLETFAGDGKARTFTVANGVATEPTITVNGTPKSVGIQDVETGQQWSWSKGSKQLAQAATEPVLTASDTLAVTYRYLYPIRMAAAQQQQITARQAVEGGSGVYEALEDSDDLDALDLAVARCRGLLEQYGGIDGVLECEIDEAALPAGGLLQAGQILPCNLPAAGLAGNWFLTRVGLSLVNNERLRYRIEAAERYDHGDWVEFWAAFPGRKRVKGFGENDVIAYVESQEDPVGLTDNQTVVLVAAAPAEWDSAEWDFAEWG